MMLVVVAMIPKTKRAFRLNPLVYKKEMNRIEYPLASSGAAINESQYQRAIDVLQKKFERVGGGRGREERKEEGKGGKQRKTFA